LLKEKKKLINYSFIKNLIKIKIKNFSKGKNNLSPIYSFLPSKKKTKEKKKFFFFQKLIFPIQKLLKRI
jgi:hypothetical protein